MRLSVRLSRGLPLAAPWWLAWLILPIALLALTLILILDMLSWLIMAPIRLAAVAIGKARGAHSQATFTFHHDAAGQPIDGAWHRLPKH
jgi:hypothetical protein